MLYGLDFNQTSNEINKINRAFNIFKTNISLHVYIFYKKISNFSSDTNQVSNVP